jgi:transposase
MSKKTRRRLDAALKAKVAAGGVTERGDRGRAAGEVLYVWKKQLLDGAAAMFSGGTGKEASREAEVTELYAKIGQLPVERDFLSRRSGR